MKQNDLGQLSNIGHCLRRFERSACCPSMNELSLSRFWKRLKPSRIALLILMLCANSSALAAQPSNSKTPINLDNQPTYIKSDTLTLFNQERRFTYSGNVEVTHGDMIMTSDTLEGFYDENNKVLRLIARKNVTITKSPNIRATCEHAIYEAKTSIVTLTENPELQQDESVLTSDVVRIFLNENRSAAEGKVRVKMVQKDKKK